MVGWIVAAEMGSEAAQNNLCYLLDRGIGKEVLSSSGQGDQDGTVEDKARVNEMAMRCWIRSAAQDNVDAMVKVGDYYCESGFIANGDNLHYMILMTDAQPSSNESHSMAAAYYQTAADTSLSSMAYWNLGWMYENGIGVKRDIVLDPAAIAAAGHMGGRLPVTLSLAKLYLRRWVTSPSAPSHLRPDSHPPFLLIILSTKKDAENASWYHDILSRGADPGLNLFEKSRRPSWTLGTSKSPLHPPRLRRRG